MKLVYCVLFVLLLPAGAAAQQQRSDLAAFLIEGAAASAGSLAGFHATAAVLPECGVDDLACDIGQVSVVVGVATAAAAGSAYLVGRWADTEPAGLGVVLGAVVGAAAGIGAWHFVREEVNINTSDAASAAIYAITQGLLTAAGSRLVRALSR